MTLRLRLFVGIVVALGLFVPVASQQSKAQAPTTKDPLRFRAVLQTQGQDAGAQGVVQIVIERWSTTAERESLVALVSQSTDKRGGQDKLLKALGKITPRVGFIRTPNSLGWDLRYAYDFVQPDGTRKIVIATDKPVSFGAAVAGAESLDYPFTLIEMRMGANSKGEGRMLARSAISTKDGRSSSRTTATSRSRCPRSPRKQRSNQERRSVVQDDTQQRAVHLEPAVVLDQPEFAELVHEEVHA